MTEKKFLLAVIVVSIAAILALLFIDNSMIIFGFITLGLIGGSVCYVLERLDSIESLVLTQQEVLRQRMDAAEEYLDRKYNAPGDEDLRRGKPGVHTDASKIVLGPELPRHPEMTEEDRERVKNELNYLKSLREVDE